MQIVIVNGSARKGNTLAALVCIALRSSNNKQNDVHIEVGTGKENFEYK